jgi:two-component system CheB/CheR fusion protein
MSVKKSPTSEKTDFPTYTIGIGASAGGLEAINEFFESTPVHLGFSYVVVQHLSPDYKSLMAELLAKHTAMPVVEAEHDMELNANTIYLLPNKKLLTLSKNRLQLAEKIKNAQPNNAIDVFFESLAHEKGKKAVGIILSGTGTDGTKGLEQIKKNGGIAIVQDPFTASFDGMPNSAIQAGAADLIISPENMSSELLEYLKEADSLRLYQLNSYKEEFVLRDILTLVRRETGHDFSHYKRPTLFRRLSKRLLELNISKPKDYITYLHDHPEEVRIISQDFLINVTYFFRDSKAFAALQHVVIPAIMKDKTHGDTVKAWSVACSSGEEAYSLAILFHEYIEKKRLFDLNIKIFATDIDREALEKASKGIFPKSALREMSKNRIANYFKLEGENYKVNPEIRKMIVFSYHDILKDPPFSRMDLVACRNMLIYISAEAQKEIIRKIHFALNVDGYLFLGSSEHIGKAMNAMQEIDKKWRIYRNVTKAKISDGDGVVFTVLDRTANPVQPKVKNPLNYLPDIFRDTLLEDYKFAGIYIDMNFEVKQATGNYKAFIDLPDSGFNFSIMKLVPPDLGIALNVAIRKAMKDDGPVSMKNVKVSGTKFTRLINFIVKPYIKQNEYQHQFLFIVLNETKKTNDEPPHLSTVEITNPDRLEELESELRETKENLQAVIEEIEAANEELQSTNEEMVSTNEELQSTNEELQSLNEELHTVSAEHQLKIKELLDLNDDLNNHFRNTEIGQVFVDKNLIIRRFTPAVTNMVNLIEADLNRSIVDITTKFRGIDFIGDIKYVMNNSVVVEREFSIENKLYLMKITQYVRVDKSTDGVVINFIDITESKKLNKFLTAVLDSSPSSIAALKAVRNKAEEIIDFEFITANAALCYDLGVDDKQIIGKLLNDIPEATNAGFDLCKSVAEDGKTVHFEYYNEIRNKWYDMMLVKLMDGLVSIGTDITERKKATNLITQGFEDLKATSKKLRATNLKLEQSNLDLLQFASVASHDLKEPLRKIQTFGNLLMSKVKDKLDSTEINHLTKIISSSARMQKLIEDVLTLSKLSNLDLEFEKVNLNEVLDLIREDLEIAVKEKKANLVIKRLPNVNAVPGQMHQIFQNLISNSLKFTNGKKPKITVAEKPVTKELAARFKIKPAKYTCISIKDNGIGFEETYKEKIFGIFQRLNGNNFEGTGIGLAICKKIIENHNGFIAAESKLGDGSEFKILLPKK